MVAVPVALGIVYLGGAALATLLAALGAIGTWELFRMARAGGVRPLMIVGIALALIMPLAQAAAPAGVFTIAPAGAVAAMLLVLMLALGTRRSDDHPLLVAAVTLFAPAYTAGTLTFGYAIRTHDFVVGPLAGTGLLLYPVALTWVNDIAAFAVGRSIGGRRLLPSVSPGKTVAGAVGALLCTVIAAWAYARWVLPPMAQLALRPAGAVVFGVAISIAAQIGDLFESLLKREAGVKDSSRIFPGHGGVLDRLDSLFFVLPVAYLLFAIPGALFPVAG